MQLEGSCHCGAVRFRALSHHPYPFNRCYCSICRKTGGGGGYAINLRAEMASLEVDGEEEIAVYQAKIDRGAGPEESPAKRHFCCRCGSALWLWDPRWPEMFHPFASAIDTPLPVPPETTHLMLSAKPDWVVIQEGPRDKVFDTYPDESIADWHDRLGLAD